MTFATSSRLYPLCPAAELLSDFVVGDGLVDHLMFLSASGLLNQQAKAYLTEIYIAN